MSLTVCASYQARRTAKSGCAATRFAQIEKCILISHHCLAHSLLLRISLVQRLEIHDAFEVMLLMSFGDFATPRCPASGALFTNKQGDRSMVLPGVVVLEVRSLVPTRPFTKLIVVLQTAVHPKASALKTNMNFDPTFVYTPRFMELIGKLNVWYFGQSLPNEITDTEIGELEGMSVLQVKSREHGGQAQQAAARQHSAALATASRAASARRDAARNAAAVVQQAVAALTAPPSYSSSASFPSSSSSSSSVFVSAAEAARAAAASAADAVARSIAAASSATVQRSNLAHLRAQLAMIQ